jgi:hypothetical protein
LSRPGRPARTIPPGWCRLRSRSRLPGSPGCALPMVDVLRRRYVACIAARLRGRSGAGARRTHPRAGIPQRPVPVREERAKPDATARLCRAFFFGPARQATGVHFVGPA